MLRVNPTDLIEIPWQRYEVIKYMEMFLSLFLRNKWNPLTLNLHPLRSNITCFQDPSTCAERSLGRMTKHYDQHSGPLQQDGVTLSGLLQVDLDGPQQIEDLAKRSIINEDASRNVFLEPTTLSLGAARIWKEHHGRRFNLYKQCKDHGQKKLAKKHGTAGASRRAQGQSCW